MILHSTAVVGAVISSREVVITSRLQRIEPHKPGAIGNYVLTRTVPAAACTAPYNCGLRPADPALVVGFNPRRAGQVMHFVRYKSLVGGGRIILNLSACRFFQLPSGALEDQTTVFQVQEVRAGGGVRIIPSNTQATPDSCNYPVGRITTVRPHPGHSRNDAGDQEIPK